jgi:D-tyrosyl-tRNA(Tyr) deacylase
MRVLLQRVSEASVSVDGAVIGSIDSGLLLLVGFTHGDSVNVMRRVLDKALDLRIFEDQNGRMNLSFREQVAEPANRNRILLVPQFTLYADTRRGRRPSFTDAAHPDLARKLFEAAVSHLRDQGIRCAAGQFGAHMRVHLVNDGPVTIWLDSADLSTAI